MERSPLALDELRRLPAQQRASEWLNRYGERFATEMREIVAESHEKLVADPGYKGLTIPIHLFDPAQRTPFEMPICAFWTGWIGHNPVPLGFQLVRGSVLILDESYMDEAGQARRVDHIYLEDLNGSGVVLDHCPGQFVKRRRDDMVPGHRTQILRSRAAGLITSTQTSGQVVDLLVGTRDEITQKLGLQYDTFSRTG